MIRTIKFRAWDAIEAGWVDEGWVKQNAGSWLLGNLPKEITLQEFTGLKDKNGKEIYEGDIIDNGVGGIFEIVFSSGIAAFGLRAADDQSVKLWMTNEMASFFTTIGNIYETPEIIRS